MNTALFTSLYLDGEDKSGSNRLERAKKFIDHYQWIQEELGFQRFMMTDNGSSRENTLDFLNGVDIDSWDLVPLPTPPGSKGPPLSDFVVYQHQEQLKFGKSGFQDRRQLDKAPYDYPYCWRSLWEIRNMIQAHKLEKIILIDSDMFVFTGRLAKFIREFNNGWLAFWCPRHQFPETSLQIIAGPDGIARFMEFTKTPWKKYLGLKMETTLPFTHVEKSFIGDRYGEAPATAPEHPDYYGQAPVSKPVVFDFEDVW